MKKLKYIKDTSKKYEIKDEIANKHEVNLQRNSSLYFQIGVILCLLATYGLFEMKFKIQTPEFSKEYPLEDNAPFYMPKIFVEQKIVEEKQPDKRVVMLTDKPPIVKPDDFKMPKEAEIVTPNDHITETIKVVEVVMPDMPIPLPAPPEVFNMKDVERVPVFPGCESASNNAERMACMSEKLTKLIQKKFNTGLASDLGLSGVQRIQVQFKIDTKGNVTDIRTRSPYSKLEKEAERVMNLLPVMTPGMQRNTPVSVIYNLPIAFNVR